MSITKLFVVMLLGFLGLGFLPIAEAAKIVWVDTIDVRR